MDYSDTSIASYLRCQVIVPRRNQAPRETVSRWSDHNVELPAMIVRPNSEQDIVDSIGLARNNNLTLLPGNGGCASWVPITAKTMYLDMKSFSNVTVDQSSSTVRVGGGATTGEVIKTVVAAGYYTLWCNSNAVGYVGSILGGGISPFTGLHGYLIDAVESIQLITTDGQILDVGPSSEGEEKALFNALCGAGHGLGIITSVVMKVFSLEILNMTEDCFWTRRVVFPSSAIEAAAKAFTQFSDPDPHLAINMVFFRALSGTSTLGPPMITLTASYFGPPNEAERAATVLFDQNIIGKADEAETLLVPLATANDRNNHMNAQGGFKDTWTCFVSSVDSAVIKESFERWVQVAERDQGAKRTLVLWGRFNTNMAVSLGESPEGQGKFLGVRDRGVFTNVVKYADTLESNRALDQFCYNHLDIARRRDAGLPRMLANNRRPGMNLQELYPKEKVAELMRVKQVWDSEPLLWSPF
ncbi:hypothetical protein FOQG_17910 [Fusarium oxysporum f. sp. raphani 54005]|uniref:FAD-binding PCMH-type domain-containing protein n=2 Tax=Fusarium oxysporum f. sp. raphani TaxID=96318 RepID=X0C3M7_FUSOX|nr:hypothetical protein FOQG_17910 [Fusarium oxysporum f. sp. raphani 54005]